MRYNTLIEFYPTKYEYPILDWLEKGEPAREPEPDKIRVPHPLSRSPIRYYKRAIRYLYLPKYTPLVDKCVLYFLCCIVRDEGEIVRAKSLKKLSMNYFVLIHAPMLLLVNILTLSSLQDESGRVLSYAQHFKDSKDSSGTPIP